MAEYLVGEAFIAEYNALFEKVNGVGSSLTTRSGNDVPARVKTIRVKIDSVVESPTPAYTKDSEIQFKATEIDTDANACKWDVDASAIGEQGSNFVIAVPLDGASLEFDWENPADSNETYEDKEYDVEPYSFKNSLGKMVRGWRVIVSSESKSNIGSCRITGDGANDQQYLVDVVLGNPNDNAAAVKGILYLTNATSDPVAVGAKIITLAYPSKVSGIKLDCFPIETIYNLVTPPDEE